MLARDAVRTACPDDVGERIPVTTVEVVPVATIAFAASGEITVAMGVIGVDD